MELIEGVKMIELLLKEKDGGDFIVDTDNISDEKFAWFVPFKPKDTIKYADYLNVGACSGFLVHKETGEYLQPGSAYPLEKWLEGFKMGLRGYVYDITITNVNDLEKSITLLKNLGLIYYTPEIKDGVEWKVPKHFSSDMIRNKLVELPCVFQNQRKIPRDHDLYMIKRAKAFKYKLVKSQYNGGIVGECIEAD